MPFTKTQEELLIKVSVQPKAKKDEIVSIIDERLKIKVKTKPEKGKANKACIVLLAKVLGVPQKNIILVSGKTSRQKVFKIYGINVQEIKNKLDSFIRK